MSWRVAPCLDQLLKEVNARWPNRSKYSDGSIGDSAHQSRPSDHNVSNGIVHARDLTHDLAHGADMQIVWNTIVTNKDVRLKYMIFKGKIMSGPAGPSPFVSRSYSGSNGHYHHIHVSCRYGATYENDVGQWLEQEEPDLTPDQDARLKRVEAALEALALTIGKPYAPDLTVLKILTEKNGEDYVDGVKQIRADIAALKVPPGD